MIQLNEYPSRIKSPNDYYAYILNLIHSGKLAEDQGYCFFEFQDASRHIYEAILDVCRRRGISEVHDIGCGYAFQAPMFANAGIVYLGIDRDDDLLPFVPRGQNLFYKFAKYPTYCPPIKNSWHTAAISSLCVGFLCEGEDVWETMARSCEFFIGCVPESEYSAMQKFYDIRQVYLYDETIKILSCQRFGEYISKKKIAEESQELRNLDDIESEDAGEGKGADAGED